jgi:hypothetical protein
MMRNVAGYGNAVLATMVGLSLSLGTPEVMAGSPTAAGAGATAVVDATIGGLATARPRLRLAIDTLGGFPVTAVTVTLPPGLSFGATAHGIRIGTETPRSRVHHGRLTVTLHHASASFVLTVSGAAMTESKGLEHAARKVIRFNEAHMQHQRALALTFTVTVASGRHATITVLDTIPFR